MRSHCLDTASPWTALPGVADILLVIEVAEASLRYDRLVKTELYARHGIREYWLLNLPERALEIYRDPELGACRSVATLGCSDTASPHALPGVRIRLAPLLGD